MNKIVVFLLVSLLMLATGKLCTMQMAPKTALEMLVRQSLLTTETSQKVQALVDTGVNPTLALEIIKGRIQKLRFLRDSEKIMLALQLQEILEHAKQAWDLQHPEQ